MALPNDPLLQQQWHLGQPDGSSLLDLNVKSVWNPTEGQAYTGVGIRTVVIDDGFDYNHSDLAPNYNQNLDYDYANSINDAFGAPENDWHGTAVAGIIGAAANGTGAVGVAFGTQLIGYRTYGLISDQWLGNIRDGIANAATNALADVVNISQGIANDANSKFGAGYDAARFDEIETSIGTAVNSGRGGLGTIIVKSAGNSRSDNYDVNADDWTNDTRQVVVAAVDQNGFVSNYSSYGAAVLVSAFGTPGEVLTTDRVGSYGYSATDFANDFNGTSSAAPMVSGVVALMLDANADLGWRDVQTILGVSARHVGSAIDGSTSGSERYAWNWNAASTWNGGGQHFSNDYGFGLVDAHAAVRMAESWLLTGHSAQTSTNQFGNMMDMLSSTVVIPDGNSSGTSFTGSASFDDKVERVLVSITFSTSFIGDMAVSITSPDGTISELIKSVGGGDDFNGTWTFESQAFRGERAAGTWTVRIADQTAGDTLSVSDVVVTVFGDAGTADRYIYTDEYAQYAGVDGHATTVTDSNGGIDTVNAAAVTTASVIRLDGTAGSIAGKAAAFIGVENAIGGDAADTIYGNNDANQLFGMRGADKLYGGAGADLLDGGSNNDRLDGGTGADVMRGGTGNDTYYVDNAGDNVIELNGEGTDTIVAKVSYSLAGRYVETLDLVGGNLNGTGNKLDNLLDGTAGNNILDGKGGADRMVGHTGNDTYYVDNAGDNVVELDGEGTDKVISTVSYTLAGRYVETLDLVGSGNINATGNKLANLLDGNNGNNVLNGMLGNDTLSGKGGKDIFVFDQKLGASNIDHITDFSAADDTIRLENAMFVGLAAGTLSAAAFRANTTGLAADSSDRIIYETDTGKLFFDRDGNGSAYAPVQFAVLDNKTTITYQDFVVV